MVLIKICIWIIKLVVKIFNNFDIRKFEKKQNELKMTEFPRDYVDYIVVKKLHWQSQIKKKNSVLKIKYFYRIPGKTHLL